MEARGEERRGVGGSEDDDVATGVGVEGGDGGSELGEEEWGEGGVGRGTGQGDVDDPGVGFGSGYLQGFVHHVVLVVIVPSR